MVAADRCASRALPAQFWWLGALLPAVACAGLVNPSAAEFAELPPGRRVTLHRLCRATDHRRGRPPSGCAAGEQDGDTRSAGGPIDAAMLRVGIALRVPPVCGAADVVPR